MPADLITLFAETLRVPANSLNHDSCPDNTPNWDSLVAINLVAVIEDTYQVQSSTRDIMRMDSIGAAHRVLTEMGVECP